jgi:peptide/nickel transport system substrate-binding protein
VARALALAAAMAVSLLAVSGAGGAGAQTPKRGGTANVVMALEPPCLNFVIGCQGAPVLGVIEGAFKMAPDYTLRPRLVSGVDVTTKPPFTLTYRIHPEARWSDGTPVSARDFVFTHTSLLVFPGSAGEGDLHKTWIRGVRALGPKTVRVVLRSRFGYWRYLFPFVLPEHALRGENLEEIWSTRVDNPKTGRPIGNGPFLVQDLKRGEHLTLVRNPRYWGQHRSYLDRIVIRFSLDPPTVGELFRSGQADIGQWQFDPALVPVLRRVPGVTLRYARDSPGWEHLDIRVGRGGHPALRKKLVRRALAYAIDRVEIARAVAGSAVKANPRPRDNLVFGSGSRSYRPNWSGYRYRPAEARRLLERAGCRRGADAVYVCAGERLALRFVSRNAIARRVQTLERVQTQARRAGIEVVPVYTPSLAHNQILETGDFDVTLFAFFGPGGDGWGLEGLYGCGGVQNSGGYCQRLVTRDLDQADRILDARRRARLLNRVDARLARDVPSIPLFDVPGLAAATPAVRNFFPSFSIVDTTWNAENWWLAR